MAKEFRSSFTGREIENILESASTELSNLPKTIDGKLYVRKNGEWTEISLPKEYYITLSEWDNLTPAAKEIMKNTYTDIYITE